MRSSRPTASTATRWRAASPPARSWPRCTARPKAAAAAAAARCTCSTPRPDSTAATRSSAAGCRWRSGFALADKMQGKPRVTACFFGEGAVAEGEFHESMNLAALWKLPVLFLCENNLYAMGTALERSEAETDLCAKAASYNMPRRERRRHGRGGGAGSGAAQRPTSVRAAGGSVFPGTPHLPLPRPLDVRSGALPQQGRSRAVEAALPDRRFQRRASRQPGSLDDAAIGPSRTEVAAESRPRPWLSPRPAPGSRSKI